MKRQGKFLSQKLGDDLKFSRKCSILFAGFSKFDDVENRYVERRKKTANFSSTCRCTYGKLVKFSEGMYKTTVDIKKLAVFFLVHIRQHGNSHQNMRPQR